MAASMVFSGVMRRVLVLGSGYTSAPLVEYLTRHGDVSVTVASNILPQAHQIASTYQNTTAQHLDVHSTEGLSSLIKNSELVISFVPFSLHPIIAKECLKAKTDLITASYVSPEMKSLHAEAVDQDIILLNEVGLDPGIDHMLAMQCFHQVHDNGGKIASFESWCGGLPHPKYCNNPLKYKFSWSPRGVLLASKNSARLFKEGKVKEIPEGKIMEPSNLVAFQPDERPLPEVEFEGYYNRDSTKYIDIYGIQEAHTVLRGTYRYKGFCKVLTVLSELGLLDTSPQDKLQPGAAKVTWRELMTNLTDTSVADLDAKILEVAGGDHEVLQAITNLGLLSDEGVALCGTVLDSLCAHLQQLLVYSEGEQDAVYLNHFIGIQWPNNKFERRHINLTMFGTYGVEEKYTAMAQGVGKPAAIAARMILNRQITSKGVQTPTTKEIYSPILDELKEEGIEAIVSSTFHSVQ